MAAGTIRVADHRLHPGRHARGCDRSLAARLRCSTSPTPSPTASTSWSPVASSTPCWSRSSSARSRTTPTAATPTPTGSSRSARSCWPAVTAVLIAARAAAAAALGRRQLLHRPRSRRRARVADRLRPLVPAADLLLRHVRAGRPDPQRSWPVRADDVGADRQQHRSRSASSPRTSCLYARRAGRGRIHHRARGAARTWLDARNRRPDRDLVPVPEGQRVPRPAAVRLPAHRPRPHPAPRACGPSASSSSTSWRSTSMVRRATAGIRRGCGGRRERRERFHASTPTRSC